MRKLAVITTLLSLPLLYGFASIVGGTSQLLTINSEPHGAQVIVDGVAVGVTPVNIKVKREKEKSLIVRKKGYQDEVIPLTTTFNNQFWGNLLIGGTLGSSTDASTGATIEYAPDSFYVTLTPGSMSKLEKEDYNTKLETRNFILANYHNLSSDISKGTGEYLSNLYGAFDSENQNSIKTVKKLREMLAYHENIPAFAEAVVNHFLS